MKLDDEWVIMFPKGHVDNVPCHVIFVATESAKFFGLQCACGWHEIRPRLVLR